MAKRVKVEWNCPKCGAGNRDEAFWVDYGAVTCTACDVKCEVTYDEIIDADDVFLEGDESE